MRALMYNVVPHGGGIILFVGFIEVLHASFNGAAFFAFLMPPPHLWRLVGSHSPLVQLKAG